MYENTYPKKRFKKTLEFLGKHISTEESILDLGVPNPLSELIRSKGYELSNTSGEDLDTDLSGVRKSDASVVTAFEILEHLVSPFPLLREIPADKLVASVPLRLWFASAYRSKSDKWDRHFHEFEDWQFDWLLEKAGWQIVDRAKWSNPVRSIGFRPFLRLFTPRYYIVYAVRNKNSTSSSTNG